MNEFPSSPKHTQPYGSLLQSECALHGDESMEDKLSSFLHAA